MTNRWMAIKLIALSLILVLVLLGVLYELMDISASAQEIFPHSFHGAVMIDGAKAPVGTVVEGRGDGLVAPDHSDDDDNPVATVEVGRYGEPPAPFLTVQGEVDFTGEDITFYVNGVRASCYYSKTGEWCNAFPFDPYDVDELDLFVFGEYTLTVKSDGCCPISVTYDAVTATVTAGSVGSFTNITGGVTVTLEAGANPLCGFDGWEGDLVSTANPISIPMRYVDKAVTATCSSLEEYALTVHTTGSGKGSVIKVPDQMTYIHGTVVTLTAVPSSTSAFAGWSGDIKGDDESITFTMEDDKEITATFEFYSVTISPPTIEQSGDPNDLMRYELKARNTGGAADVFTVTAFSSMGWPIDTDPSVEANAGSERWVDVRVQIPSDASGGTVDVLTVTLTSQGDPRKSATALLKTTVTGNYTVFLPLVTKFD